MPTKNVRVREKDAANFPSDLIIGSGLGEKQTCKKKSRARRLRKVSGIPFCPLNSVSQASNRTVARDNPTGRSVRG